MKKGNKIVAYLIVIILLVCNISLLTQIYTNKSKTPNLFGIKAYAIASGSMVPEFYAGDLVLVKNDDVANLNQIIAYKSNGMTIVHRVLDIQDSEGIKSYKTKGDSNDTADEKIVETKDIEGIYIGRIPFIGYVMFFLEKTYIFIVGILVLIILINCIYKQLQKNKEEYI